MPSYYSSLDFCYGGHNRPVMAAVSRDALADGPLDTNLEVSVFTDDPFTNTVEFATGSLGTRIYHAWIEAGPDDLLHLFYILNLTDDPADNQLWYHQSRDGGFSWGNGYQVPGVTPYHASYDVRPLLDPQRGFIIPWVRQSDGQTRLTFARVGNGVLENETTIDGVTALDWRRAPDGRLYNWELVFQKIGVSALDHVYATWGDPVLVQSDGAGVHPVIYRQQCEINFRTGIGCIMEHQYQSGVIGSEVGGRYEAGGGWIDRRAVLNQAGDTLANTLYPDRTLATVPPLDNPSFSGSPIATYSEGVADGPNNYYGTAGRLRLRRDYIWELLVHDWWTGEPRFYRCARFGFPYTNDDFVVPKWSYDGT